jgi:hypothetical protein
MPKDKRTPSGGYSQDWPAYNAAQINEKKHFLPILHELCQEVAEPERAKGRIPFPLKDMVLCVLLKIYSTFSSKRFVDDLHQVQAAGLIESVPSPNSISEYLRKESLTKILQDLITKSSLPLAETEKVFAVDSTGFAVPKRRIWFNRHKERQEKRRDFMKLHVMIGVGSTIITCAEPTEGSASDRNYLRSLIEGTARHFEITEVSADAGYISGENMRAVLLAGGIPYIAFAKNYSLDANYKSTFWKDLLYLYKTRHPQFTDHYYLRNNVESSFSAMKGKFGGRLRSKSKPGQFNEALGKALCHNICILIKSMYVHGIDPTSWAKAKLRPEAESGLTGAGLQNRERELVNIRIAAAGRKRLNEQETVVSVQQPKEPEHKRNAPKQPSLFEAA